MAKPDNVSRFFFYLSILWGGRLLHQGALTEESQGGLLVQPVKKRQFLDDMAYLKELLPSLDPGCRLEYQGEGRYALVRSEGGRRLSESEFLPFLSALARTTNLFPYSVDAWLPPLARTYGNPGLDVLEGRILYTSTPHPDRLRTDHFHTLVESLVRQTRVDLTYRNRQGVDRQVDFEPLAFFNQNGVWYLVGDGLWAHRTGDSPQPTQLKLSRVRLCRRSERPYRRRFDLEATTKRLLSTFGSRFILEQLEPQTVTLRFHGEAVRFVEESYFHQGQQILRGEGFSDLTIRVNDLFDALQLAGQWGPLVRPLSPPELVRRWKERAAVVADWAQQDTGAPPAPPTGEPRTGRG